MRILFVQRLPFAHIGAMLLSAELKRAGHEVDVLIAGDGLSARGEDAVRRADLLGFHWVSGSDGWLRDFLSRLPARPPVVVGGPHPTFVPDDIRLVSADFAIRGEADEALPELAASLDAPRDSLKNIKNLCFDDGGSFHISPQRPLVEDLDSLPFQDVSLYARIPRLATIISELYPAMCSRGCPNSCSYCFNKKFRDMHKGLGAYTRRRSPANVVEELLRAKKEFSIKRVVFEDDSFITSKRWLEEFAELYAGEVALPFVCQTPATTLDAETAGMLARMGCVSARVGLETADEGNRRKILRKNVSDEQITEAVARLKERGIMAQTYNMVGIPGEGFDDALKTMLFNRRMKTDFTWVSFYRHYPGTELRKEFEATTEAAEAAPAASAPDGFFTPSAATSADRRMSNLGMLMQFFNVVRAPVPAVRLLCALPLSPLYALIHKAVYALSVKKINRLGWLPFIRISLGFSKFF